MDTIELWESEIEQNEKNMRALEEAKIYNFYDTEPVQEGVGDIVKELVSKAKEAINKLISNLKGYNSKTEDENKKKKIDELLDRAQKALNKTSNIKTEDEAKDLAKEVGNIKEELGDLKNDGTSPKSDGEGNQDDNSDDNDNKEELSKDKVNEVLNKMKNNPKYSKYAKMDFIGAERSGDNKAVFRFIDSELGDHHNITINFKGK